MQNIDDTLSRYLINKKRYLINEYFALGKEYNDIFRRNRTDKFWKLSVIDWVKAVEIEDTQDDIYDEINEITNKIDALKQVYQEKPKLGDIVTGRIKPRAEYREKSSIEGKIKKPEAKFEEPKDLESKTETREYKPKHTLREELETRVWRGYYERIKDYSGSLDNGSVLKKCSEILSGDYIKENGRRAWTWKQREEEIRNLYRNYKEDYTTEEKEEVYDIIKIVNSNRYAKRVRKKELKRIYTLMKKPKKSRFMRLLMRIKDYVKDYKSKRGGKHA